MDKFEIHIENLNEIIKIAYNCEYENIVKHIEKLYFQSKVFNDAYYQYADDFVFRRDVTDLSYSKVFKLAFTALKEKDYGQYLLGLKIVIVKLKGNQRYTYFDRDKMKEMLKTMSDEYGFKFLGEQQYEVPDIVIDKCREYLPIGFEGMDLNTYRKGSTRSVYSRDAVNEKEMLEKQYISAVNQGNIYHHIVETDHMINRSDNILSKYQFIHVIKLLSAQYATEKSPWSKDLIKQMLTAHLGLMDCCDTDEFKDLMFRLVSGTLKIVIKRLSVLSSEKFILEIEEFISYLANIYCLDNNERYIEYIQDLINTAERKNPQENFPSMRQWIKSNENIEV